MILQCILGFQRQIIDFTNACAQAYIPSGEPVFIEIPGVSIVMEENMMLFSNERKSYMVKPKLHTYGMKSCEMVY